MIDTSHSTLERVFKFNITNDNRFHIPLHQFLRNRILAPIKFYKKKDTDECRAPLINIAINVLPVHLVAFNHQTSFISQTNTLQLLIQAND